MKTHKHVIRKVIRFTCYDDYKYDCYKYGCQYLYKYLLSSSTFPKKLVRFWKLAEVPGFCRRAEELKRTRESSGELERTQEDSRELERTRENSRELERTRENSRELE